MGYFYHHVIFSVLVLIAGYMIPQIQADFIEQPESLNATVNSTRIFRCRAENGVSYAWRINGTPLDPDAFPEGVILEDGGSSLSVYCDEGRNMSTVMCFATLDDFITVTVIPSDEATLLIQGRLGRVTNLRIDSTDSTSITLTWEPPFSLDITGVEPDFNYTIVVYNTSSGTNTTYMYVPDTEPKGRYVFRPESYMYPDPSVLFEFFVTAVNELGLEGEPSEPVRGCFLGPVRDITFSSTKTVITLTWSPPDGPLGLTYSYCMDVSLHGSNTAVMNTTCDTTLEFLFTMDNPNPDDTFKIFITPMTNLYPGERTNQLAYFIGEPVSVPGGEVQKNVMLDPLSVSFSFSERVVSASPGRRPTSYRVFATSDSSQCQCDDVINVIMSDVVTLMVGDCDGCLSQGQVYSFIIQTVNEVGVANSSGTIMQDLTSPPPVTTESTTVPSGSVERDLTAVTGAIVGVLLAVIILMVVSLAVYIYYVKTKRNKISAYGDAISKDCYSYQMVSSLSVSRIASDGSSEENVAIAHVEPTYVEPDFTKNNVTSPPASAETTIYDVIQGELHGESHYAHVDVKETKTGSPVVLYDEKVIYSELKNPPPGTTDTPRVDTPTGNTEGATSDDTTPEATEVSEAVMTYKGLVAAIQLHVVSEWKKFGEALGLDPDDRIDEIFTNNNGDDTLCCDDMLENYVHSTSEELLVALIIIGRESLAEKLCTEVGIPFSQLITKAENETLGKSVENDQETPDVLPGTDEQEAPDVPPGADDQEIQSEDQETLQAQREEFPTLEEAEEPEPDTHQTDVTSSEIQHSLSTSHDDDNNVPSSRIIISHTQKDPIVRNSPDPESTTSINADTEHPEEETDQAGNTKDVQCSVDGKNELVINTHVLTSFPASRSDTFMEHPSDMDAIMKPQTHIQPKVNGEDVSTPFLAEDNTEHDAAKTDERDEYRSPVLNTLDLHPHHCYSKLSKPKRYDCDSEMSLYDVYNTMMHSHANHEEEENSSAVNSQGTPHSDEKPVQVITQRKHQQRDQPPPLKICEEFPLETTHDTCHCQSHKVIINACSYRLLHLKHTCKHNHVHNF